MPHARKRRKTPDHLLLSYDATARRIANARRADMDSAGWSRFMLTLRGLAARTPYHYRGYPSTFGRYRGYDAARRIAR